MPLSADSSQSEALIRVVKATVVLFAIGIGLDQGLEVIFGEDARRLSEDNAPQNFSLLTKMALNLLRQEPSPAKKSLRLRRKRIGWDDEARMALLGLTPL